MTCTGASRRFSPVPRVPRDGVHRMCIAPRSSPAAYGMREAAAAGYISTHATPLPGNRGGE
ncbi:hypothetical protein GCM10022205_15070 [Spinactinospora alkalitolerans]